MRMFYDQEAQIYQRLQEELSRMPLEERRRFVQTLLKGGAGGLFALSGALGCTCEPREGRHLRRETLVCGTGRALQPVYSPFHPRIARVIFLMFSPLWRMDRRHELEPVLATRLDVSDDGREYVVELRKDATWHDGRLLTAHDVVFTIQTLLRPATKFHHASILHFGGHAVRVRALSNHRVRFVLAEPRASFAADLASKVTIAPKHLLQGKDPVHNRFNRQPIGSGPFKFEEHIAGSHISMVRNSDYFEGKPALKRIVVRHIPDAEARLAAYQAGDLDAVLWEEEQQKSAQYAKVSGSKVYVLSTPYVQQFALNNDDPLFRDASVRKAIAHALDRPALVRAVMGSASPARSIIGSNHWAHCANVPSYPYDPRKAAALLESAGWRRAGDGYRRRNGTHFRFVHEPVREWERRYAVLIQHYLKQVGIRMEIRPTPDLATAEAIRRDGTPQSIIHGCIDYEPGELSLYWHSNQTPPRGSNVWRYRNARVDQWLDEGQSTTDSKQRKDIYARVQKQVLADCATIPLHEHLANEVVRVDRVTGFSDPAPNYNGWLIQAPWKPRLRS